MTMHDHMHGAMTALPEGADPTVAALCADPWMWIGHGIAAVVTIVALYHGERAVRVLLELARSSARGRSERFRAAPSTSPGLPRAARVHQCRTVRSSGRISHGAAAPRATLSIAL
jgi:hypothetical protein